MIDLNRLYNKDVDKLDITNKYTIPKELIVDERIKELSEKNVEGYIKLETDNDLEDELYVSCNISGTMKLLDSIDLNLIDYDFSIDYDDFLEENFKNNLTEPVKVTIKLVDDNETIEKDNCIESSIPKEYIKVSIKENNGKNNVYTINELTDDILLETEIEALDEQNYTIRVWVASEIETTNLDLHYHGKIQIIENDSILARR